MSNKQRAEDDIFTGGFDASRGAASEVQTKARPCKGFALQIEHVADSGVLPFIFKQSKLVRVVLL